MRMESLSQVDAFLSVKAPSSKNELRLVVITLADLRGTSDIRPSHNPGWLKER
jgi:hypothetical protein